MPIIRSDCPVDMENAHHTVEEIKKITQTPEEEYLPKTEGGKTSRSLIIQSNC